MIQVRAIDGKVHALVRLRGEINVHFANGAHFILSDRVIIVYISVSLKVLKTWLHGSNGQVE
jgi:hypothetical protein